MERTQGLQRSITLNEVHGLEVALAKWISVLASPPLLGLTGIAMLGMAFHRVDVWLWAGFYAFSSIVAPILVLLWFMHTGEVSDFHMKNRGERIKPLAWFLLFSFLSWLIFYLGEAPYLFQALGLAGVLQSVVMFAVTTRWKISGHSAGAAGFSALLLVLFGSPAAPAIFLIPLVIWARLQRNRHDLAQSLAGAALGAGTIALAFALAAAHCPQAALLCLGV